MQIGKIFLFLAVASLFAQPEGFKLISGQAALVQESGSEVMSSGPAIVEWDRFSIGEAEEFRFTQDKNTDCILNRVTGSLQSAILGQLHSNGQVILVNPQGVLIGPNAKIDTAGLIASSLDVLDADFLAGQEMRFFGEGSSGVTHLGTIESVGDVFLVGALVNNEGVIRAHQVGLGVGRAVLICPEGPQRLWIEAPILLEGEGSALTHSGVIEAARIELRSSASAYQKAIQCSGVIDASQIEERGGEIYLVAEEGICEVSGSLAARGERGGEVQVLGDHVHLLGDASVDVSGATGGGIALIGGDYQGKNEGVKNSLCTYVEEGVLLRANALERGDAGQVILWSDGATTFHGFIEAQGGALGGDGGFVEVSGKQRLGFNGMANTAAPFGRVGTILLDPTNIEISGNPESGGMFGGCTMGFNTYTPAMGSSNVIDATHLSMLLDACNVTIATNDSMGGGTITVSAPVSWSAPNTLTLTADGNIVITASITNMDTSSSMHFDAMKFTANAGGTTAGSAAGIQFGLMSSPPTLSTTGKGDITLDGHTLVSASDFIPAVFFLYGNMSTTEGNITITGIGEGTGRGGIGFLIAFGDIITADGTITIHGKGLNNSGTSEHIGIYINAQGTVQATGMGDITIVGIGGDSSDMGFGIRVGGDGVPGLVTVANGTLTMTGWGAGCCNPMMGIFDCQCTTGCGAGMGSCGSVGVGSGGNHTGFSLIWGGIVSVTGTGSATITGYGGVTSGTTQCSGVACGLGELGTMMYAASSGTITLTGYGGRSAGTANHGIELFAIGSAPAKIESRGSGTITLNGTAGSGGDSYGIQLGLTGGQMPGTMLSSTAPSTGQFVLNNPTAGASSGTSLYGINYATTNGISFNSSSTTRLSMTGIGGGGSGSDNQGVRIASAMTCYGAIEINGTGGNSNANGSGCLLATNLTNSGSTAPITFGNNVATSVALGTDLVITTNNGAITFDTGSRITGAQNLTLTSGSGAIAIKGDVGTTGTRLTQLNFTSSSGGLTIGPSTVFVDAGFVPAMAVSLNGATSITTTNTAITFDSSSTINNNAALALDAGTNSVTLNGVVGGITPIGALSVTTAGMGLSLGVNVSAASVVVSSGVNTTLSKSGTTAITTTGASGISFGGTITGTVSGAQALTLNAGANPISLSGALGGTRLGAFLVAASSGLSLGDNVAATSVTIASGIPTVLTKSGTTTITSTTSSGVSFGGTLNGTVSGSQALTVTNSAATAPITFSGATGGVTPLGATSCTTVGGVISTGAFTTAGAISFDTTNGGATATGAAITLNGAVAISGMTRTMALRAGSTGVITFSGDVGSSGTRLTGLTFTSGASFILGANVYLTGSSLTIPMQINVLNDASIDTQ